MTEQAISPLRRRMIEDMSIRKFAAKTQHDYVQRVKDFATFLGRSPGTAEAEDVRRFRLHLTANGAGTPKINATVAALRFFFKVSLDRPDLTKHLSFIHEPRKPPVVLSPEEALRAVTDRLQAQLPRRSRLLSLRVRPLVKGPPR
jgi:integrase/recombinase XerD